MNEAQTNMIIEEVAVLTRVPWSLQITNSQGCQDLEPHGFNIDWPSLGYAINCKRLDNIYKGMFPSDLVGAPQPWRRSQSRDNKTFTLLIRVLPLQFTAIAPLLVLMFLLYITCFFYHTNSLTLVHTFVTLQILCEAET